MRERPVRQAEVSGFREANDFFGYPDMERRKKTIRLGEFGQSLSENSFRTTRGASRNSASSSCRDGCSHCLFYPLSSHPEFIQVCQFVGEPNFLQQVSHIIAALVIGHFGGSGHRPRWISAGMFLLGLAMLLFASPEFLFPVKSLSTGGTSSTKHSAVYDEMCAVNKSSTIGRATCTQAEHQQDSNLNPLIVFGVAEFLMGLGATTVLCSSFSCDLDAL